MTAQTPIMLIDAPSLYFRAYFGIPESAAKTADGQPVNAVRGFLDMLAHLVRTRRPGRMVCAMDHDWRPDWRVALLPSYKAHRVAPEGGEVVPDTLSPQVPMILEVLDALGVTVVGATGYEADDVLGTLSVSEPGPVEVVSGDRDLFQLIDDARGVRLLYVGRGVAKLEDCDDAAVRARYGVPADRYAEPGTTWRWRPRWSGSPWTCRCHRCPPSCRCRRPTRNGCSTWPSGGTSPARPGAWSTRSPLPGRLRR